MRLSDFKAGSGVKQTLPLPVTSPYSVEMTVICGSRPGKNLVVTAGVHSCEYVGIETLNRLKRELEPAALSGRVILLPLVNPEGFYQGSKQTIPADGKNLNRMFPGKPDGTFSSQLARVLEETLYPEADFLMDLHGGDVNEALTPLVFFPASVPESLSAAASAAAESLSVPYRVASTSQNGLYSWAAQCGIPALLVERGDRGLWSEKEVAACRENVYELMRHLGILNAASVSPCLQQAEIRRAVYEEAPADGFWYPAVSAAGQKLKQGTLLGTLKDSYGNEIARYTAPFDGVVLYYTLSLGVKSGDPLIAYGKL
ncbi:ectoine utilization protein EutE [uncultured Clostridium sp.]|nr:ectoine utilization protein EutE [uncultured Clostridium sp.]